MNIGMALVIMLIIIVLYVAIMFFVNPTKLGSDASTFLHIITLGKV